MLPFTGMLERNQTVLTLDTLHQNIATHKLKNSPSEIISTHFEATLKSQALVEKCGKTKTIQIFAIL